MTGNELKQVIVEQREEIEQIMEKEKIIQRELSIKDALASPNTVVITGPRRAGKSFLSILTVRDKKYGYLNFDDERLSIEQHQLNNVLEAFYELYGDLDYLVFDEIQDIPGWELFINRLRRTKRIIITGSNSKLLSRELATHLTGRHIDYTLYPFSFREYLRIKDMEISGKEVLTTRMSAKIKKEFTHYLNSGGFPEVLKFGKAILRSIYEDVIYKDIISRYKIRKTQSFKELVRVLASNYSKEFTYTKLKKVIRLKDIETIKKFVDYLDSSYLFFVLEQFSYKLKRQMLAPKKIYSIDPGMIEIMAFKFSRDPGKVIENVVAIELQRQKCFDPDIEIFYWKNERGEEVDFVVKKGNAVHELIQVSYEVENPLTREREIKALLKGAIELRCKHLKIITDDYEDEEQHKDLKIIFIPLWKWLLAPLG